MPDSSALSQPPAKSAGPRTPWDSCVSQCACYAGWYQTKLFGGRVQNVMVKVLPELFGRQGGADLQFYRHQPKDHGHMGPVHCTRPSCVTISVASSTTSWRGLQTRSTHVCQRPQRIIIRQHRAMPRACCTNCQKWPSTRSWTWYGPCLPSRRLSTSCLPPCWSLLSVSWRRSSSDWRICFSALAFFHQHWSKVESLPCWRSLD